MDTTLSSPLPIGLRLGTIFFSPPAAPCRRPSMPSMRGTEKPQMSASSTPTVKPLAARAAARLTVTEDLPTPPLPEATVMTRCRGWDGGLGGVLAHVPAGLGHGCRLLLGGELGPVQAHGGDAGERADPGADVALDLCPQGAAGRGQGDGHHDLAVGADGGTLGHAQLHDVATQLGVDDAAQQPHDLVDRWERGGRGAGRGAGIRRGRNSHRSDFTGIRRVILPREHSIEAGHPQGPR